MEGRTARIINVQLELERWQTQHDALSSIAAALLPHDDLGQVSQRQPAHICVSLTRAVSLAPDLGLGGGICLGLGVRPARSDRGPIQDRGWMGSDVLCGTGARFAGVDAQTRPVGAPFGMVGRTDPTAELVGDLVVAGVGVAESADELGKGGGGKGGAGHVDGGGGHTEM